MRADGSLAGATLPTIWTALELFDLDAGAEVLRRMLAWVSDLQGKPGAFHEGCTAARHSRRVCEHFLGGFYSPAPPTQRVSPITLPNGKVYRTEPQARFALSCLALRLMLRAGRSGQPGVRKHLASFGHLQREWERWGDYLAPDLMFTALQALGSAPADIPDSGLIAGMVQVAQDRQLADGTWPGADLFLALDALADAPGEEARQVLARAAAALLTRQRQDGGFGGAAQDERALIGLRAVLRLRCP